MMEQKDWPLLPEAIRIVVADDRASTSYLQRKLAIGYNQAARLIEEMEARGVVSKPCQYGKRDVLWGADQQQVAPPDQEAVLAWLSSRSTGASAKSIVAVAQGTPCNGDYPHDEGDFGRCERAMEAIPSLRDHLPKMAQVNAYWAALVPAWDSIAAAADKTAAIRAIIQPIEELDPGHVRIGTGMSVRTGGRIDLTSEQVEKLKAADRKRRKAPPMKNTPEDKKVEDRAYGVAADELRQFIEQFEQLEAEKKDTAERQKEVMAEAKARGYDTKVMKQIITLRRRDKDDVAEEEAILDMYKAALGMV